MMKADVQKHKHPWRSYYILTMNESITALPSKQLNYTGIGRDISCMDTALDQHIVPLSKV